MEEFQIILALTGALGALTVFLAAAAWRRKRRFRRSDQRHRELNDLRGRGA